MKVERDGTIEEEMELYSDCENGLITREELYKLTGELGFNAFLKAKNTFAEIFGYHPIKVPVYGFYDSDILDFERAA